MSSASSRRIALAGVASALAVLTGSGLKDVRAALRAAGRPVELAPDDRALDEHLREHPLG